MKRTAQLILSSLILKPCAAFAFDAERFIAYHDYITLPLVLLLLPMVALMFYSVRLPGKKGRKGL